MTRCSSSPTSPKTATTVSGTPSRRTAARRVTAMLSAAFRSRPRAGCAGQGNPHAARYGLGTSPTAYRQGSESRTTGRTSTDCRRRSCRPSGEDVLAERGAGPVQPVGQPVLERVAHGVPPPRPESDVQFLMQFPKLVANLNLGATADLLTDARPGRTEPEVHRPDVPVPRNVPVNRVLAMPATLAYGLRQNRRPRPLAPSASRTESQTGSDQARRAGLEPATRCLEGSRSIH
jgi:hypothetical protein